MIMAKVKLDLAHIHIHITLLARVLPNANVSYVYMYTVRERGGGGGVVGTVFSEMQNTGLSWSFQASKCDSHSVFIYVFFFNNAVY